VIAISYRREDTLPIAGRLYDRLQTDFGKGNVFMDFDSIPYGVDFREHIKQMLDRSKVLIALIGPDWFGKRRQRTRRIDDPADFVRLEIAYAFERGIPVIPVLINDTPMPKSTDLPSEIEELAFRNAVTLDVGIDFHPHANRLIVGINRLLIESARSAAPPDHELKTRKEVPKARLTEHSAAAPETPSSLFQEPQRLQDWTSIPETPSPLPSQPSTVEEPTPRDKTSVPNGSSPKQRLTASVQKSALIKETPKNRTVLLAYGAFFTVVMLVTGLSYLYFGSSRMKQSRQTQVLPAVSEEGHPAVAGHSPPQRTTDFAKHAAAIREQEIARSSAAPAATPSAGAKSDATAAPLAAVAATSPIASPMSGTPEQREADPKAFAKWKFEQAQQAAQQGYPVTALAFLDQADEADPNQPSILNLRGEILVARKEFDPAEAAFRAAIKIDPKFLKAQQNLAEIPFKKKAATEASPSESAKSETSVAETKLPSARNGRTWQAWIGEFVRQFVAANQLRDVDANLTFYGADVDYFDDGRKDHAYIRPDIEKYNERWPIRRDSIEGDIHLQENSADQKYHASFKLNFYAESPARAEWSKGQFAIDLEIRIVDGVPNISGIKEEISSQQKGKTNAAKPTAPPPSNAINPNEKLFAGKWKGTERAIATDNFKHNQTGDRSYKIEVNLSENTVVLSGAAGSKAYPVTNRRERSITWEYKGRYRTGTGTMTLSQDGKTATVKHALRDKHGTLNSVGTYQKLK
jgi:tetratricopeptide (TPR) repeat protein